MTPFYNGLVSRGPGIYAIVCGSGIFPVSFYVGSTKCLEKRKKDHLWELRRGTHHCIHLQRAWNKHSETAFEFWVIEQPSVAELHGREQLYLNIHFGKPWCYNTHPVVSKYHSRTADPFVLKRIYSRKKTLVERKKISQSRMGKYIKYKDRGWSKETNAVVVAVREDLNLPTVLQNPKETAHQLREAYNCWSKGSLNVVLREQHNNRKKRLKKWLIGLGLWYDGRSDSWFRKSPEHQAQAKQILAKYRNQVQLPKSGVKGRTQ